MAQVFTSPGLQRIIRDGLSFGAPIVTLEALENEVVQKSATTSFNNPSLGEIDLNQVLLENFTAGTVIDKIQLKIDSVVIWYEDNLNYDFVTSGDLTIDFSISLSGNGFFTDGLDRILARGLDGAFIGIYLYDNANEDTLIASSDDGVLEPGGSPNVIQLKDPVVFNITGGSPTIGYVKYTIIITKDPLIEDDITSGIRMDSFTNDGTLTFSSLEFTLNS